jgi:hypothetical protein
MLENVKKLVPSRIELLILALLAPRLNQLGQGTFSEKLFSHIELDECFFDDRKLKS